MIVYVVRESIHICRMWRNFAPTCFINLVKHTCKWDNFYAILVFFLILVSHLSGQLQVVQYLHRGTDYWTSSDAIALTSVINKIHAYGVGLVLPTII